MEPMGKALNLRSLLLAFLCPAFSQRRRSEVVVMLAIISIIFVTVLRTKAWMFIFYSCAAGTSDVSSAAMGKDTKVGYMV